MVGDLFMVVLTVEHPIGKPIEKRGDEDGGRGDNDDGIDGLDLDEVGEMDTDKSGSNEKSPRDKGKGPEQTPPTKQGRGNHEGSGGSRTKTDSAQNTSDIAAYIMEAVQQEGITEEQVFQLLREMELVDEVGDFI